MRSRLADKLKKRGYSGPSYGYKAPPTNARFRRLVNADSQLDQYRKSVIISAKNNGKTQSTKRLPDVLLLSVVALLIVMGLVMVYSASSYFSFVKYGGDDMYVVKRQLKAAFIGLVCMLVAYFVPYRFYQGKYWWFVGACLLMLIGVFIPKIGAPAVSRITGQKFYRSLNFGFMTFQPVEFAKLTLAIYMADFLSRKTAEIKRLTRGILPGVFVLLVFFGLVYKQPDLSSAAFLGLVVFTMLFIGGARVSQIVIFGIVASVLVYNAIKNDPYRYERVRDFVDQIVKLEGVTHIRRSFQAISLGGITGVGFGGSVYKMAFLPMAHTDFIFSIIGEELGAIGMISLIGLYMILIWRGVVIADRCSDLYGSMLAMGITCIFAYQVLMNIGVALGMLPITGVTLPFISKGGSSLMISMTMVGILLNISRGERT